MDFGVAVASNVDAWRTARRAEELGFSHAWFYDSQMLVPDIFVSMALAAVSTKKIKLGMGVLVPSNRIAPAAANGVASLNQLAPGRIILGLGTGFTARNTMGLGPVKLADLAEYIRVIKGLLAGETLEWTFEGARKKIRFLNPDFGLINIKDRIPIHLSAFAPKARKLTAEIADGWMTFMRMMPQALHEVAEVSKACREAGRPPESLYKTAFALGCILADGEAVDSARAKAQAGPLAAVVMHGLVEQLQGANLPAEIQPLVDAYRKQYETYEPRDARYLQMHRLHLLAVRPEEARFLTPELIRMTTFTATAPELRERLHTLGSAGYQHFVIQLVPGHESALEEWARLFEKA